MEGSRSEDGTLSSPDATDSTSDSISVISSWGRRFYAVQGSVDSRDRYFMSPVGRSCRDMEGFLIWGWPFPSRLRQNFDESMAGIFVFIPSLLEKSQRRLAGIRYASQRPESSFKIYFSTKAGLTAMRTASGLSGMLCTPRPRLGAT